MRLCRGGEGVGKPTPKRGTRSRAGDPKPRELAISRRKRAEQRVDGRTGCCGKSIRGGVARGERPNKRGDSWFSTKAIEVAGGGAARSVGRPWEKGSSPGTDCRGTTKDPRTTGRTQTEGAKVLRQKGNSPDQRLRAPREAKCHEGGGRAETVGRWAWKQPSGNERVTAHPRSRAAPKMSGTWRSLPPKPWGHAKEGADGTEVAGPTADRACAGSRTCPMRDGALREKASGHG